MTTVSIDGVPVPDPKLARLDAETRKLDAEARNFDAATDRLERLKADEDASAAAARIFTFYGEITSVSVAGCMQALGHWARRDEGGDIRVVFASPGGSVLDGFALFDFLRELSAAGNRIETVALGFALSMGAVLMQAGDHRVIGTNASLMFHDTDAAIGGSISELEESTVVIRRMQKRCVAILAERSTLTATQIEKRWKGSRSRTGWWLESDEALALGFCDEVR